MSKGTIRIAIFAIILVVVSVSIFSFMVLRVISQGEELSLQINTLQESAAQEDSYYNLQRLADETALEREELQTYFLAKESESIDFLNLVESLAPQVGVSLSTVSLEEVIEDGNVAWVEPTFSFSGSRDRVGNFIKILETLPYVLRISSVDMASNAGSKWEVQVTMQVRVLSYD